MRQKLHSTKSTTIKNQLSLTEGICPFTEEPSTERFSGTNKKEDKPADMDGDVLFSLFTANIINEEIVFTR